MPKSAKVCGVLWQHTYSMCILGKREEVAGVTGKQHRLGYALYQTGVIQKMQNKYLRTTQLCNGVIKVGGLVGFVG